MVLFLGVMGNLTSLLALQSCQRNNSGFKSVELQSAELLCALEGTTVLVLPVGSGQAGGCVGAYLLP